ncbi:ribonuclease H-like domain-containing protein, partial [Tanacetum coccineum]
MKAVKDKDALQKIVDSWFASSKNLWKLTDCGMSLHWLRSVLGYGIQSNAEVLGYEEEISRGIFAFRETDAGYNDIPLYSRFNNSTVYSTCPSNDSDGELGAVNLKSPKKCFSKQSSPVNRPFSRNTAHKSNKYAVKGKMGTAVKTSAGCVWRKVIPLSNTNSGPTPDSNVNDHPLKHMEHRGIFDSGCSGHMTGNRAHLEDYQELYLLLLEEVKDSISGKGTIRLGNLVFDDVAFVKELEHFNLFSISQICDKKLNVLFTEKECFVVSSDFNMPDENQVLLKVPRQHNMYTFDMKNVASSKGYTCLLVKASKLWHRRLGHLNFKNLNKLVKGNLVRGLPSKNFKNDHTCVACQKGKQHKASCKAKIDRTDYSSYNKGKHFRGGTSGRNKSKHSYCATYKTQERPPQKWLMTLAASTLTDKSLNDFDELMSTPIDFSSFIMNGISHWREQRKSFYAFARGMQSRGDVYSTNRILSVTHVSVMRKYGYWYLEEIVVRRADNILYRFKEGDFPRLRINDTRICYYSLWIRNRSNNLSGMMFGDFSNSTRMYTRIWLMRSGELYKFIDGMLTRLLSSLEDITKNIDMTFDTSAGNPVKEILLKLSLPDHRIFKDSGEERYEHVGPDVTSARDGKVYKMALRDYAWLMISRVSKITSVSRQKNLLKSKVYNHYNKSQVNDRSSRLRAQDRSESIVMVAHVISILSDLSEESVGSHAPRVILFGAIPAIIPVIHYSPSSDSDPSEDSLTPVPDLPLVLPFLCSDDTKADGESEPAEQRPVSSSRDTLAPLLEFPLAPIIAPHGICRRSMTLVQPGEAIPFSRPYRTHPNGPSKLLTAGKRVRPLPARRLAWRCVSHHSSDRHSSPDSSSSSAPSDHSLSAHTPPDTTDADSSTLHRFVHRSLARTPRHSEAFRRWRSAPLSTPYLPTTSESSLGSLSERLLDSSSPSSRPSRKRCRSPTTSVPSSTHVLRSIAPTLADLLPPRKRFNDSYSLEDREEEHIEVDTADTKA